MVLRRAAVRALAQFRNLRFVAAPEARSGRQAHVNAALAQLFRRFDQRTHFGIEAWNQHVEAFDLANLIETRPEGLLAGARIGQGEGGIRSVLLAVKTAFERIIDKTDDAEFRIDATQAANDG
jgi:hypothetical protein